MTLYPKLIEEALATVIYPGTKKKKKIMLLALGIMGVLPLMAQGSRHFTIDGEMTRDSMRYEPKAIQKVYLKHIVNGRG